MKKWFIGSLVGAILVFLWQFLSWTVLELHSAEAKYTPAQDSILATLTSTIKEDGVYMIPTTAPGTAMKDREEFGKSRDGKPFASVTYVSSFSHSMTKPMIRGFLIDMFLVFLLIYILTRGGTTPKAYRVVAGSVAAGFFCWLMGPYTAHNWFQVPLNATMGHLIDAVVAWTLAGIWLGWWLNRK